MEWRENFQKSKKKKRGKKIPQSRVKNEEKDFQQRKKERTRGNKQIRGPKRGINRYAGLEMKKRESRE